MQLCVFLVLWLIFCFRGYEGRLDFNKDTQKQSKRIKKNVWEDIVYRALWKALQVNQNIWFWIWLPLLWNTLWAEEELQQICQAQFPFTRNVPLGFSWQPVRAGDHICWSGALSNRATLRPVAKVLTKLWSLKKRFPKLGRPNLWSALGKGKETSL